MRAAESAVLARHGVFPRERSTALQYTRGVTGNRTPSTRRLSKVPAFPLNTTLRVSRRDAELLFAAARLVNESQSEFVRAAVRERTEKILSSASEARR